MPAFVNLGMATIGCKVGLHPKRAIGIALLVLVIALVAMRERFKLNLDITQGYTRADAASKYETDANIAFFENRGKPWYMGLFAEARGENASMLAEKEYDEFTKFFDHIVKKMRIVSGCGNHTFLAYCEPFCDFNGGLFKLMFAKQMFALEFDWPVTKAMNYMVNIGKWFFQRKYDKYGHIKSAKLITTFFTAFVNGTETRDALKEFERMVFEAVKQHNARNDTRVRLVVHGAGTVSSEVQRGTRSVLSLYIIGGILTFLFVLTCMLISAAMFDQINWTKPLLGCITIISPLFAGITAFGMILLAGYHINMLMLISPFLVLAIGIGVDDAFLLHNTWLRLGHTAAVQQMRPEERLQAVFEEVGIAVAVTSLTNALGFGLGCIAPVPEIRLFCCAVALAMLFDLFFQIFFFAPFLVIFSRYEEPHMKYDRAHYSKKQELAIKLRNFIKKSIIEPYCNFATTIIAKVIMLVVLSAYLFGAICGIMSLGTNMDGRLLLPPDSQSVTGLDIMTEKVWPDYLTVVYIIRKPPNFTDPMQYRQFQDMIDDIEAMPQIIGSNANQMWLRDYERFYANYGKKSGGLFDFLDETPETTMVTGVDMQHFDDFLNDPGYKAWKNGVRYTTNNDTGEITITAMLFMAAYNDTHSLADKARLVTACREMAAAYSQFDVIPFETDAHIIDVILQVPRTTFVTMLATTVSIAIVFLLLIGNVVSALIATGAVASISAGVLGYLHYWGCYLDPLTMVAVIMTVGLSVDFTVHIVAAYQRTANTKVEGQSRRLQIAFQAVGVSMIQAALSTAIILSPVLLSPIGVYVVVAKAIIMVVAIGLLHSIFFVPILLAAFPNSLTGKNCCFT